MEIHALGTLGGHFFHKAIMTKTWLACCIKVMHISCNTNAYVHVHFFSEKYEPTYCQ